MWCIGCWKIHHTCPPSYCYWTYFRLSVLRIQFLVCHPWPLGRIPFPFLPSTLPTREIRQTQSGASMSVTLQRTLKSRTGSASVDKLKCYCFECNRFFVSSRVASVSYDSFPLNHRTNCQSFHDIMISVRVVPPRRNTEMLKVRLFTLRLMRLGIVWIRLTSSVSPSQRLHRRSTINSIGVTNNVVLSFRRGLSQNRGIEYFSAILLYPSQGSVLVTSSGNFLNGSTEHSNTLVTNMLKTWLTDDNMRRNL